MTEEENNLFYMISEKMGQEVLQIFYDEYKNFKYSHNIKNDDRLYEFFSQFVQIKFIQPQEYIKTATHLLNDLNEPTTNQEDDIKNNRFKKLKIKGYDYSDSINIEEQNILLANFRKEFNIKENDKELINKRNNYMEKLNRETNNNDKSF